jgi:hypothetical protein
MTYRNSLPRDFHRVAMRYDRPATNYTAAVCIATTIHYWL